VALRVLIGSIAVSAVLGVWAILVGDFGEFEAKVLLTSLTVSGASILAMACGAAWERRSLVRAAAAGIGTAVVTGALILVGIWGEVGDDEFWRTTAMFSIVACACAHASLLSLAVLESRFRWVQWAAFGLDAALAGSLILFVWDAWTDESAERFIGVVSILLASATIAAPVLHRMSRLPAAGVLADALFCPSCGNGLQDSTQCLACGARFRVEFVPRSVDGERDRGTDRPDAQDASTADR
jgi:hypothetical protein